MESYERVLRGDERAIYRLRGLYDEAGYRRFRSGKFEEYEIYGRFKDFLGSDGILTFTDSNGKLMALKPDVTLTIAKNFDESAERISKLYYNDEVYRLDKKLGTFKEIEQTGIECIGDIGVAEVSEVISLAVRSLGMIDPEFVLDISHMGLVRGMASALELPADEERRALECVAGKNVQGLRTILERNSVPPELMAKAELLVQTCGPLGDVLDVLEGLAASEAMKAAVEELHSLNNSLDASGLGDRIRFDFSVVNDMGYYNGVIFKGFVSGLPTSILAGGRYDNLLKKMGKDCGAIGFSISLDLLAEADPEQSGDKKRNAVNVALPKGRLGESVYKLFEKAGFDCPEMAGGTRKLVFENSSGDLRFFWVKPQDVAIYVERGAADIGVVGKDVLLEKSPDVYELLDMNCGRCRMMVAGKKEWRDNTDKVLKVATKFPNIAKRYYNSKSREIDIIKLNGSIELAPILELSDVIVDLVETGNTLKANGLEPKEEIVKVSARLISNKASSKFKTEAIEKIVAGLSGVV